MQGLNVIIELCDKRTGKVIDKRETKSFDVFRRETVFPRPKCFYVRVRPAHRGTMYASIVQSAVNIRSLDEAREIAFLCNTPEDDWSYRVVEIGNGRARVDVYDEEGVLVHAGF
jgi:hypothetical protein